MSTIRERAPLTTDQLLDELHATLQRAEKLWTHLHDLLAGPTAADPDPLAEYRLPGGTVAYTTTYVDRVRAGDWVQACHGDTGWHQVDRADIITDPLTLTTMVNVDHGDTNRWWAKTDTIRVACTPGEAVARQGAGRAEVTG